MIAVTKTFLPPFEEYTANLKRAWDNEWITNNGALLVELEEKLKAYLGVKHLLYCTNGTVVLQLAIHALELTKEIITTPFSYVATTNAIIWEKCTPVFVDINPLDFCIDADKIEAAITENTQAIMATHVYGNPCNIEKIQQVADKYNLKVIYDAAHAFGSSYNGKQLLGYGDISTCSFHATKIFHTVEGGCLVTDDAALYEKLKIIRSFGHLGDEYFEAGINAKNSEFHAAMGLTNLPHMPSIVDSRRKTCLLYYQLLSNLPLQYPAALNGTIYNYAYFPVVFKSEATLLLVMKALKEKEIIPRRYFFPALNRLPYIKNQTICANAESIAKRVLCLPLYHGMDENDVKTICSIIKNIIE
jgi:dTDP-4-amino-4,6-dideoxygalactose transaminase